MSTEYNNEQTNSAGYQQPQDGVSHETGDPYTDPLQDTEPVNDGGAAGGQATEQELLDELGIVARQVRDLAQAAWHSEQRQQLQAEIKRGVNTIAINLEEGFNRFSQSDQTKESVHKARDAAESMGERIRETQTGQELADVLLRGLRSISRQLNNMADELEPAKRPEDNDSAESGYGAAQDIPVQRDDL